MKRLWQRLVGKAKTVHNGVSFAGFANRPKRGIIMRPRRIKNPHRIAIGEGADFGPNCKLHAILESRTINGPQLFDPWIRIGERVFAEDSLRISCVESVEIGNDVMFGPNVFISDCGHCFQRLDVPFSRQGLDNISAVKIGSNVWIGANTIILPGVTIGNNCVIGAASIVAEDVPDGFVTGSPKARLVLDMNG